MIFFNQRGLLYVWKSRTCSNPLGLERRPVTGKYEKIFHTPLTSIMYNNKIWMQEELLCGNCLESWSSAC